jgi:hypothetical protein
MLQGNAVGSAKSIAANTASSAFTSELRPAAQIFTDIPADDPNAAALLYLKNNNIMGGYADGSFGPDKPMNRAELMKTVLSAVGMPQDTSKYKNCFTDVRDGWFAPYVCYGKSKGWVSGYNDGSFRPSNNITRVEALKIIIASYGLQVEQNPYGTYSSLSPDFWYSKYVWTADKNGLMQDWKNNTTEYLVKEATRIDVATAIYRLATRNVQTI